MDQVIAEDPALTEDEDEDEGENAEAGRGPLNLSSARGRHTLKTLPNPFRPYCNFSMRDSEL